MSVGASHLTDGTAGRTFATVGNYSHPRPGLPKPQTYWISYFRERSRLMNVELQTPPTTSQASAAAKLVIPRDRAIQQIRAQLEKGLEIKRTKIRYVPELERAREAKGEWTTTVMTLLKGMFSSG